MTEPSRIEDLRRRVQQDPASIAFAQLGEELRRARRPLEAMDVCRAGLALHPNYLSARVTLGRALLEVGRLDDAHRELSLVVKQAPDNLAARRSLGDVYRKRGGLEEALDQYRTALGLAPRDPDLERLVDELTRALATRGLEQGRDRSLRLLAALEAWLPAIHVARTERRA